MSLIIRAVDVVFFATETRGASMHVGGLHVPRLPERAHAATVTG